MEDDREEDNARGKMSRRNNIEKEEKEDGKRR